jgi:transposase
MPDKASAHDFLAQWCGEVERGQIHAFMTFANTVKVHWQSIVHFFESRISNGVLEGINNAIQLAKHRARGFRNIDNSVNMIYFLCCWMKFDYPLISNRTNIFKP